MRKNPLRYALFPAILLAFLPSRPAQAVELSWSEGVSRIRISLEQRNERVARDTLLLLLRDYPEQNEIFALDVYFTLGDQREALSLLSHIAYKHTRTLFDRNQERAISWSLFPYRIDSFETVVARNPTYDKERLLLGYYLLLSGMPLRGERILSRIAPNTSEWEIAQIILDAFEGRFGNHQPRTYAQPPVQNAEKHTVTVVIPTPIIDPKPRCSTRCQTVREKPRLFAQAGYGAIVFPEGVQENASPALNASLGLRNQKGYSLFFRTTSAPKVGLILGGARKEVALGSVGLGFSYSAPLTRRASLRPVFGLGIDLLSATPIRAETALSLGASGTFGLRLSLPMRRSGALQIGAEATGSKPLLFDNNFPEDLPAFLTIGGTVGVAF